MSVGIALGSNLGESERILNHAIDQLKKLHTGSLISFLKSSFYKTAPVDCPPDSPFFLNAVVQLETTLSPMMLFKHLQDLEVTLGRPSPHPKNAPRTLDLDFLYYDSIVLSLPGLQLPHPRAYQREFVLLPLSEIAPDLILPGWSKTAREYLLNINN